MEPADASRVPVDIDSEWRQAVYSQIRTRGIRAFAARELPAIGASLVLAELFFKFHSFTLECLAFLATWFCLSWVGSRLTGGREG